MSGFFFNTEEDCLPCRDLADLARSIMTVAPGYEAAVSSGRSDFTTQAALKHACYGLE